MKKLIADYKLTQKIVLSIIIVLLLSFAVPVKSQAGLGGILLDPLFDLVGTVLDIVTGALQAFLVDGEFSNAEDGDSEGFLNAYLVDKDKFDASKYPEFAYSTGNGEAQVEINVDELDKGFFGNSTYAIPVMKYSPEKIFAGLIPALDINFVNPIDWEQRKVTGSHTTQTGVETNIVESTYENGEAMNERSITRALHNTIASWYVSLRNLAVVALMLVLVYVGIRIVISSTASEKSKYKQMLTDWLVALCILFCLHYIMTFTTTIVNEVTKAITGSVDTNGNNIAVEVSDGTKFNTDLMGLIRFRMQAPTVGGKILYLILYLAMVIYTCMFTFQYLKRVLMIAFLTLISPLVAMTYPIDKIRDGKAQAFDMWLKEYIFNALLQPFHLIIYSIFVGSAIDLAVKNPLFAIVALAFITPAEKILRKFFGFEKASTAGNLGALSSMVGGAAAYKALGNVVNRSAKNSKGGSNNVRTKDRTNIEDPNSPSGLEGYTGKGDIREKEEQKEQKENKEDEKSIMQNALEEAQRLKEQEEQIRMQEELRAQQEEIETRQRELDTIDEKDDPEYYSMRQAMLEDLQSDYALNMSSLPQQEAKGSNTASLTREPQSASSSIKDSSKEVRGIRGGFIGAGRAIKTKASTTLGNKQWRAEAGKGVLKMAGHTAIRAGTAVAAGTIGVAAGIAGDNIEDVFTYGLGGATLGATVGGNVAINGVERLGRGIANSAPVQGFVEGFSGKSSTQRTLERQKKEMINDKNFQQQIQQTYQPEGKELSGRELMNATERAADFVNYGVDSQKLAKALSIEDGIRQELEGRDMAEIQKQELARTQTTTAMKMASKIKDPTKLANEEYVDQQVQNWTKTIMKKNSALTEKEAKQNAEQMMKIVKKIHKMS